VIPVPKNLEARTHRTHILQMKLAIRASSVNVVFRPEVNLVPHKNIRLLKGSFKLVVSFFLTLAIGDQAKANPDEPAKTAKPSNNTPEDYKIGADDVLTIAVSDAPEFGGRFRVSDTGMIELPGISQPILAEGQSPFELAHAIRQALIEAKQLRDPRVTVFVDEFHGRTVTVLGAVTKPAVYPLQKRTTVLEALSLAGGPQPNAGNMVTIVRGAASAEATGTSVGSVQILQLGNLVDGKDLSANVDVKNGDVVSVSAAQLVYVVGAVVKPGGFTMADPTSGVSVVQAVALAQGLNSVASHHGVIVRQSTSDKARVEIPVDIGQMMEGKNTDVILAPNDILYIPTSGTKKTLKVMGDVAMAAVTGIAIYGIGYRVGNVH
jgi:polysaccharide export outer membrane protein